MISVASMLIGASTYAWFTDTVVSKGNLFQAGTLTIDIVEPEAEVFIVEGMAPGDVVTGNIVVQNTGSLDMKFRGLVFIEKEEAPEGGHLADVLYATVTVTEIKDAEGALPAEVYPPPYEIASGTIRNLAESGFGAWDDNSMPGVPFGPDWTYELEIEVEFPSGAGSQYQGAYLEGSVVFEATQWENPGWDEQND